MNMMQPVPKYGLQVLFYGYKYMKKWPKEKRLALMFPENRIIKATAWAIRVMPPIAIFTLIWQIMWHAELGPAVATALFACSLPLQGLWWLGKRSITPLPPRLSYWFNEMREKMRESGQELEPLASTPPTYQNLAELLNCVFKFFGHPFIDEL